MSKDDFTPLASHVDWAIAAIALGVSKRTLARYAARPGSGLRSILIGGKRMFRKSDFDAWIAQRERQAPMRRSA